MKRDIPQPPPKRISRDYCATLGDLIVMYSVSAILLSVAAVMWIAEPC